jgi:hypothetical protein
MIVKNNKRFKLLEGLIPTLFMNGKRMQRRSFDDFKEAIESNLKQK